MQSVKLNSSCLSMVSIVRKESIKLYYFVVKGRYFSAIGTTTGSKKSLGIALSSRKPVAPILMRGRILEEPIKHRYLHHKLYGIIIISLRPNMLYY